VTDEDEVVPIRQSRTHDGPRLVRRGPSGRSAVRPGGVRP